jgi:hypothetical protein
LNIQSTTEGEASYHKGASIGSEDKDYDDVTIDLVEDEEFVANDREELLIHEKACWEDS